VRTGSLEGSELVEARWDAASAAAMIRLTAGPYSARMGPLTFHVDHDAELIRDSWWHAMPLYSQRVGNIQALIEPTRV
jgi:hypothetical protein